MADIRINALATTATTSASDDYIAIDGTINGTRKMSAATPAFLTSVTVPTIKSAAGANLNVSVGTAASDIEVHNATTDATSSTAAGTTFAGGVAIAKKLNVGTEIAGATAVLSSTATAADYLIGTSGPSVKSSLAARQPAQGPVFDGTAGATVTNVPTFGTADFTIVQWVRTSLTTNLAGTCGPSGNGGPGIYVTTADGKLNLQFVGTALVGSSASGLLVANKMTCIAYTRTSGVGQFYGNGIASGASFTDTSNYTAAIAEIGKGSGLLVWNGEILRTYVENRALSASEVLALYESGAPAAGDYGASGAPAGTTVTAGSFVVGKKYRIASAGTTDFTLIGAANSSVGTEFTATGVGTGTGTATAIGLLLAPEANAPGNGLVWNDQSGNGAHIVLPSTGVSWALPSNGANRIRGTTNTNGNQALLGATTLIPANAQITRVRARSRSGTPSITIGTASGGSQIVSSVALSTTWKDLTIALTGGIVSTADDIWIGSNSTDVVETDITWEPLNF
jgi:hypothetical protein